MPSPDEIVLGSDLIEKINHRAKMFDKENETAIYNYEQSLKDWKRNRDLYLAAKQPVPPKPVSPMIRSFDSKKWIELLMQYHLKIVQNIGTMNPTGEFDGSAAYTATPYVSPNDVDAPAPSQPVPTNPIGKHSTGNRYDVAAGYKPTDGEVFEPLGAGGPKFVATVIAGPFGNWQWWTLARS